MSHLEFLECNWSKTLRDGFTFEADHICKWSKLKQTILLILTRRSNLWNGVKLLDSASPIKAKHFWHLQLWHPKSKAQ